jgi:hypothetical protein
VNTAYNRLQLVIESIKRLHRVIDESDQQYIFELCPDYIKYEADNYVGELKSDGVNHLGYVGNLIETSDPEADLNLICDVDLRPNNESDGQMLHVASPGDKHKEDIQLQHRCASGKKGGATVFLCIYGAFESIQALPDGSLEFYTNFQTE